MEGSGTRSESGGVVQCIGIGRGDGWMDGWMDEWTEDGCESDWNRMVPTAPLRLTDIRPGDMIQSAPEDT
jgi:hypothetical protein